MSEIDSYLENEESKDWLHMDSIVYINRNSELSRKRLIILTAAGLILTLFILSWVWHVKQNRYALEGRIGQENYVTDVHIGWGSDDVTWTNPDGTFRCDGWWSNDKVLVLHYCWQIIHNSPPEG